MTVEKQAGARGAHGIIGSLREALAAASRDDTQQEKPAVAVAMPSAVAPPPLPLPLPFPLKQEQAVMSRQPAPTAAEAARDARGGTPNVPPVEKHAEPDAPPTTRVMRASVPAPRAVGEDGAPRTQFVRGKGKIARQSFHQDPVVGWLVVVGGPGLGAYRPIYEGNNTLGRSSSQRIAIDFGDDAISSEEQAYVRYDGGDRSYLFVPNLAKTNVVAVNDKRPTSAVALQAMDVITVGRTQLVFVPFCGPDFDWADISEAKA